MQQDTGNRTAPIYLIGDSEPAGWRDMLTEPLDDRHPTRHNIWTAIWDRAQERVFATCGGRLDRSALYIRNAVRDPADKPSALARDWGRDSHVTSAVAEVAEMLAEGQPLLVISFGQFAHEFCRRVLGEEPRREFQHRTMTELGAEFRRRLSMPTTDEPLLVPLLHAPIARGAYLDAHTGFCEAPSTSSPNYFQYAGTRLADWILERREGFAARGAFLGAAGGLLESTPVGSNHTLA